MATSIMSNPQWLPSYRRESSTGCSTRRAHKASSSKMLKKGQYAAEIDHLNHKVSSWLECRRVQAGSKLPAL